MASGRRSRVPIPGAPFAQWSIVIRPPLRGWPLLNHELVESDGENGLQRTFVGDAVLCGREKRIHLRVVRGIDWRDSNDAVEELQEARDTGTMGVTVSLEEASESEELIPVRDFYRYDKLRLCTQAGCDRLGQWHLASTVDPHTAHDMGRGGYVCRLRFVGGAWEPEVRVSLSPTSNYDATASRVISDLQWVTREAEILNRAV